MILITGGTGFLGREILARLLLNRPNVEINLLARASAGKSAEQRVQEILLEIFGDTQAPKYFERVKIHAGDVKEHNLGLGSELSEKLSREVREIYHSAASTNLDNELEKSREINVGGTYNVLKFAERCSEHHGQNFRLFHVSTAYVAGAFKGIAKPEDLNISANFRNAYERSKAEAEALVRSVSNKVPSVIFRPSIIVGDSVTGQTSAFNVIYVPAKLLVKGVLSYFPACPQATFDVVPVDYVADAIVKIAASQPANGSAFHLSAGVGRETSAWEILDQLFATFNKHRVKGVSLLQAPPWIPPEILSKLESSIGSAVSSVKHLERFVSRRVNVLRQTLPFLPYFLGNPQFDNSATVAMSGRDDLQSPLFNSYAERIFKYCLDTNWGKLPWENPGHFELWRDRVRAAI